MSKSPQTQPNIAEPKMKSKENSRSRSPERKTRRKRRSRSSSSSGSSASIGYRRINNRQSGTGYRRGDRNNERRVSGGGDGERNRVHVANIDESVSERDIEDSFKQFGMIEEIWLATYAPFYSFVRFKDSLDAEEAARTMNQRFIRNCKVKVTIALPRRRPGDPPPRRNYGFGRRSPMRYGRNDRGGCSRYRSPSRSPRRCSRSPPPRRRRSRSSSSASSRSRSK